MPLQLKFGQMIKKRRSFTLSSSGIYHFFSFSLTPSIFKHGNNLNFSNSLHGLVRGDNMELGRDSDTGGQVHNKITFPSNTKLSVLVPVFLP